MAASSCFFVGIAVLLISVTAVAGTCNSGIMQLDAPPPDAPYDPCTSPDADRNSIKAICGVAFKVTVVGGIVRLVPLETGSFNYSGPGPSWPPPPPFNCKDHNASGLFVPKSKSRASVMLYDDLGGPLSNLTKAGPSKVSLSVGHTYNYRGPQFACTYNYTVVSGCVLGAKPPTPTPAPCAPGYISKSGRYGLKYCSPCPKGTYSPGGAGATACTPCPVGTAGSNRGSARGAAQCRPCNGPGEYAPGTGREYCDYCSSYDNKWTDGKYKCESCPAGSTVSAVKPYQCVKCYAGKKCCTVNADKDCPPCTGDATPQTYTSIFAFDSATPASCVASNYALCAPKINITVDSTCTISISNMDYANSPASDVYCTWSNTLPIQGAALKPLTDLAQLGQYYSQGSSLLEGNLTAVASPYIEVTIPTAKCKLRYRALTAPAASILGAAPKPAPAAPCPAGKYIDTSTDTKPGPCLPCPPGTYSTKPGTTGACRKCLAGTYSNKYGSTRCSKCRVGTVAFGGAASCSFCQPSPAYPNPGGKSCTPCPPNTNNYYQGTGTCLGNAWGSTCCAAGACGSQVPCGSDLTPTTGDTQTFQAIFRLVSSSVAGSTCKNATFLSCLRPGAKIAVNTYSYGLSLDFGLTRPGATCATNASYVLPSFYGGIAATNRALVNTYEEPVGDSVSYEILTDAKSRTFTMFLAARPGYINSDSVTQKPSIRSECSATFELVEGYLLDLKPPTPSACPAAAVSVTLGGRTLCRFCGVGSRKTSAGECKPCPRGTYQPLFDGAVCRSCPAGYSCYEGTSLPQPCSLGQFGPKSRLPQCLQCPAGTFSLYGALKKCTKCPKGTIAPKGASACGVPFLTKF